MSTVEIAGKSYKFNPPNSGVMLNAYLRMRRTKDENAQSEIMLIAMIDWLAVGVGEKRWEDVESRMDRGEVGAEDLATAFKAAMEDTTGRPFTSSPAASPQRQKKRSGAKRSRQGSGQRN